MIRTTTGFVGDMANCYPGQKLECVNCGKVITMNWGLDEPDHLSNWINPACCPHRICQHIYSGEAQKQKDEMLKAAYETCGPSEEVKAVYIWFKERGK